MTPANATKQSQAADARGNGIPADAEEAFQRYLASTVNYNAAIEAAGDKPWHGNDIELRRALFMRRYQRPETPKL